MSRLGLVLCAVVLLGLSGCVVSPGYCCYHPYYHPYPGYYHPYYYHPYYYHY